MCQRMNVFMFEKKNFVYPFYRASLLSYRECILFYRALILPYRVWIISCGLSCKKYRCRYCITMLSPQEITGSVFIWDPSSVSSRDSPGKNTRVPTWILPGLISRSTLLWRRVCMDSKWPTAAAVKICKFKNYRKCNTEVIKMAEFVKLNMILFKSALLL